MARPITRIDPALFQFCTVRQLEMLEAVEKHGSYRAAARALGVNYTCIPQTLDAVKAKAAMKTGYSPEHGLVAKGLPGGFLARGISLHINKHGKPANYWLKGALDQEQYEKMVRGTVQALTADLRGLSPLTRPPKRVDSGLLSVYPLGDPHFGMYAWAKESGESFDLKTAERLTLGAVDRLVSVGPASETAIILPLGDVFHQNDRSNQTPAHRHVLDVDGRFPQALQVGIKTFKHAVLRALQKHQNVVVRFVKGNHDPDAIWALSVAISEFFSNEPRVTVDLSPAVHWYYRFGRVLIGATHGDETKHRDLLGVMAVDRAEDWGATWHRYFYTGHVHNQIVTELPGLLCESFRTLAAADAYSKGHGYRAGRDMRLIVHHRDDGEIERYRCDARRLLAEDDA